MYAKKTILNVNGYDTELSSVQRQQEQASRRCRRPSAAQPTNAIVEANKLSFEDCTVIEFR
jgi:hypothetical protein